MLKCQCQANCTVYTHNAKGIYGTVKQLVKFKHLE